MAKQLVDEEFREAAGVLEMISKSPEDRQLSVYEARMKFLHDQEARLIAARAKGRAEGLEEARAEARAKGREEGSLAGKIQMLQQLVGEADSSVEELLQRSPNELMALLLELQSRLRSRDA